ncbi:flagellar protein FlgN [Cytobacillus sp. FJAT-53684]|uniref:Flagellar protein FlgN n=1 Tax=Cytobacillus mangrovibacter TaxID=3299024 RepID=A0ABW6K0H8_9BACI
MENIITSLENLLSLHIELIDKSRSKTEVIKSGDVEALKMITSEERNFIKSINHEQKDLLNHTILFLAANEQTMENPTLRDCLAYMEKEDREKLTNLQTLLTKQVVALKKQNDLNQQLLEQSLAFVQMSLDLLKPDMDTFNYERPDQQRSYEQEGRSIFDSNA